MIPKISLIIMFTLLTLMFWGCGGGGSTLKPTQSSNTSLVGIWLGDCTIDSFGTQIIA